jgi:hypothetical protein
MKRKEGMRTTKTGGARKNACRQWILLLLREIQVLWPQDILGHCGKNLRFVIDEKKREF